MKRGKKCMKCGGKMKYQGGGRYAINKLGYTGINGAGDPSDMTITSDKSDTAALHKALNPQQDLPLFDTALAMDTFSNLLSEISGRVERHRQDQYDYQQQANLGQMNAMPVNDYQPNPYSLYAKYGGKMRKGRHVMPKKMNPHMMSDMGYTNNAQMDMTGGDADDRMQGGGLTRQGSYGSASHPYPSVAAGDFAGPHRSYPIPTRADAVDALRLAHLHHDQSVINKVKAKYPGLQMGGVAYMKPSKIDPYFAQNFGANHNIPILAESGYSIGTPKFVDQSGNPYVAPPVKALPMNVPGNVGLGDIQSAQGKTWYTDPTTGDVVDVDPSVVNLPRFRKPTRQRGGMANKPMYAFRSAYGYDMAHPDRNIGAADSANYAQGFYEKQPTNIQFLQSQLEKLRTPNRMAHEGDREAYLKALDYLTGYNEGHQPTSLDYWNAGLPKQKKGGHWLQGAVNPAHKGYCTPMTKSTCTGHRRAFALMMKRKHGFN